MNTEEYSGSPPPDLLANSVTQSIYIKEQSTVNFADRQESIYESMKLTNERGAETTVEYVHNFDVYFNLNSTQTKTFFAAKYAYKQ